MSAEKELLEKFEKSNELKDLESDLNQFNIFKVLKLEDYEIRHSNFLAWLLDPQETHKLGDYFLRDFFKHVDSTLSDYSLSNLDDIIVERERSLGHNGKNGRIDLLLVSDNAKIVCGIENKIKAEQMPRQLKKYRIAIEDEFPGYKILFIYLRTDTTDMPDDDKWTPVDYSQIAQMIARLLKKRKLSEGLRTFISHYRDILKGGIKMDDKLDKMCKNVYSQHRKAMDYLFQWNKRQILIDEVYNYLLEKIEKTEGIDFESHVGKSWIRFIPKSWKNLPSKGDWDHESRDIVLFEIQIEPSSVKILLTSGRSTDDVKSKLQKKASEPDNKLNEKGQWTKPGIIGKVYSFPLLEKADYNNASYLLWGKLEQKFSEFIKEELPELERTINSIQF